MTIAEFSRNRVAEIIVTYPGGARRGSGYQVATRAVLTAAHVLDNATKVVVRFEADTLGERCLIAEPRLLAAQADIALLELPAGSNEIEPTEFGRLGDRLAVLEVFAVGFPRWKLRDDATSRYRDSYQLSGRLAVLSNWREGTLEITTGQAPGLDMDTPWAGMSGAALWVSGRIVGVVAKHHPGDGMSTLAGARFDKALAELPASRLVRLLPTLPVDPASLVDVVPLPSTRVTFEEHRSDLVDAAPDQLLDREHELQELARFCAGNESIRWLQAAPWAGKTALMSWFALNPPEGIDVVAFLINGRYATEADSDAFLASVIEQLSALCGEPSPVFDPRAARRTFRRLLEMAATRSASRGRQILLLIDGLDEDKSRARTPEMSSIAAVLPRRIPERIKVLVASRPHPELPGDVVENHPLRSLHPVRLTPSPHAKSIELSANTELDGILRGIGFERTLLGLITASGGGLTGSNLAELTGRPPYEVQLALNSQLGRILRTRRSVDGSGNPEVGYLLAHATLRASALEKFGTTLTDHRTTLHAWADVYATKGWPSHTPGYLLRGYPKILDDQADAIRLLTLATDSRRLDLILRSTGGDVLALSEIEQAVTVQSRQTDSDVEGLLILKLTADDLLRRNSKVPVDLPVVWAALGSPDRAVTLARSATDPTQRAAAMCAVIESMAATRDSEWRSAIPFAEAAIAEIHNRRARIQQMCRLSLAISLAGDHGRASRLLSDAFALAPRHARGSWRRLELLSNIAETAALIGDSERVHSVATELRETRILGSQLPPKAHASRALGLAAAKLYNEAMSALKLVEDPEATARAVSSIASIAAANGDFNLATRLARNIEPGAARARACCEVAASLAAHGSRSQARNLCRAARSAVDAIADPAARARNLADIAEVLIDIGDNAEATELIDAVSTTTVTIARQSARARTLSRLGILAAKLRDQPRATELALQAEHATRLGSIGQNWLRVAGELAVTLAASRNYADALELADAIRRTVDLFDENSTKMTLQSRRIVLLHAAVATAAADTALPADRLITELTFHKSDAIAMIFAAVKSARAGRVDFALRICDEIASKSLRIAATSRVAKTIATAAPSHASSLFHEMLKTTEVNTDDDQMLAMVELSGAAVALGLPGKARELVGTAHAAVGVLSPTAQVRVLAGLAATWSFLGEHERCADSATSALDTAVRIKEYVESSRAIGYFAHRVIQPDLDVVERLTERKISLRQHLATVMCEGHWPAAVPGVIALDGNLTHRLAERIVRRLPSRQS